MHLVRSTISRNASRAFLGLIASGALLAAACTPAAPAAAPTAPPPAATAAAKTGATVAAVAPTAAAAAAPAATAVAQAAPTVAAAAGTSAAGVATSAAKPAAPAATTAPAPVATTAAKPAGAVPTLPKPEKVNVKIGFSALEAIMAGYAVTLDQGLFKKYGFENVELLFNEGDTKALQALVSGGVDATAQGPAVVVAAAITDVPLVTVAMSSGKITDILYSSPNVKTAADLKGKKVAVSSFGGTSHSSVLLALKGLGLTERDVTIVPVGGEPQRVAALKGGSVDAIPAEIFRKQDMQQQGFNALISVADTPGLEYIRNGLNFRQDYAKQNPNTVLALTAALLEGQQLLYTQTDKSVDAFAKFAQITDRADAEARVKSLLPYLQRDMRWTKNAWEIARDTMASQNAALKEVDVTKGYTFEYLDKLQQMGFNDAIGVPKS